MVPSTSPLIPSTLDRDVILEVTPDHANLEPSLKNGSKSASNSSKEGTTNVNASMLTFDATDAEHGLTYRTMSPAGKSEETQFDVFTSRPKVNDMGEFQVLNVSMAGMDESGSNLGMEYGAAMASNESVALNAAQTLMEMTESDTTSSLINSPLPTMNASKIMTMEHITSSTLDDSGIKYAASVSNITNEMLAKERPETSNDTGPGNGHMNSIHLYTVILCHLLILTG